MRPCASDRELNRLLKSSHDDAVDRGTLRALGLGRIGKSNVLPDRPEIRGMLARVPHLVMVEETSGAVKKVS